jgi:hypothetical protein
MRRLNPRSKRYIRQALAIVRRGRTGLWLTDEEAAAVMDEASATRWHATHGLEYRFLVAFLKVPQAVPEALEILRVSDFSSLPYAAAFGLLQAHGDGALDITEMVRTRRFIPPLETDWWAEEARATLRAMLARRDRWLTEGFMARRKPPDGGADGG